MENKLILTAIIGIVLYILLDILEFNSRTKLITYFSDTLKFYFTVDNILKIIIAIILVCTILFIVLQEGGIEIAKRLTGNVIDDDTPAMMYLFAFIAGILNQLFVDKILNILNRNAKQLDVPKQ